jgi:hypothetical protein
MNQNTTPISFPARPVELKVRRAQTPHTIDPAAFAEVPLHTATPFDDAACDLEALRVCEENLRAYEQRLREWQDQLEQAQTHPQVLPRRSANPWALRAEATVPARQDAWQKLLRARELLEVEQKNLRDDRISLQGLEEQLKEREARITAREARIAAREQQLAEGKIAGAGKVKPAGPLGSLTRGRFALARSVFGAKA